MLYMEHGSHQYTPFMLAYYTSTMDPMGYWCVFDGFFGRFRRCWANPWARGIGSFLRGVPLTLGGSHLRFFALGASWSLSLNTTAKPSNLACFGPSKPSETIQFSVLDHRKPSESTNSKHFVNQGHSVQQERYADMRSPWPQLKALKALEALKALAYIPQVELIKVFFLIPLLQGRFSPN